MAFRILIFIVFFASISHAHAWSPLGHSLVGELAQRHLTPAAQAEVADLLKGESDPTLSGIASWADELRHTDPELFKKTSKWHYINTPPGTCEYVAERDCKNGDCVIAAIQSQLAILSDTSQPKNKRRDALKFVVHFVGDVHQPMHSNNRDDAGGNKYQISLRTPLKPEDYAKKNYVDGVMGTNLHAVWDYYVLGEHGLNVPQYADELQKKFAWPPAATGYGTPVQWANESCSLVDAWGIYPDNHKLDTTYGNAMRPLAERRAQQAGYRLSYLLNQALGQSK